MRDGALSYLYSLPTNIPLKEKLSLLGEKERASLIDGDIVELSESELLSNPYYRFIEEQKAGFSSIKGFSYAHYEKDELFQCGPIRVGKDFETFTRSGYYKTRVKYPIYRLSGRNWMEVIPHEIATMEGPISLARGKVLVYGLGIGYFPFMVSNKEDVESVTIIEKDNGLAEEFCRQLLPLFPNSKKISIEVGDALDFACSHQGGFDFLFADIYHDEIDGLPLYCKLKSSEGAAKLSEYWIEEEILAYLRRYLIALIEEEYRLGNGDEPYMQSSSEGDRIYSRLHFLLKGREIEKPSDIEGLCRDESLRLIASMMGEDGR